MWLCKSKLSALDKRKTPSECILFLCWSLWIVEAFHCYCIDSKDHKLKVASELTEINFFVCWRVMQFIAALYFQIDFKVVAQNVSCFSKLIAKTCSQRPKPDPAKHIDKKPAVRPRPNADSARLHHRRKHSFICFCCHKSCYRRNLI